jgi:hypothetical protein
MVARHAVPGYSDKDNHWFEPKASGPPRPLGATVFSCIRYPGTQCRDSVQNRRMFEP